MESIGVGSDREDGQLREWALVSSSSLAWTLGSGELLDGTRTITLTVTDSDGMSASDAITVTVLTDTDRDGMPDKMGKQLSRPGPRR